MYRKKMIICGEKGYCGLGILKIIKFKQREKMPEDALNANPIEKER